MDTLGKEARSRVMRAIRSRWAKQERLFASLVSGWEKGTAADANADFVFRAAKVAVFLDDDWDSLRIPLTLPKSWKAKLERVGAYTKEALRRESLERAGWEVLVCYNSDFLEDPGNFVEEVLSKVLPVCTVEVECQDQVLLFGRTHCRKSPCLWVLIKR